MKGELQNSEIHPAAAEPTTRIFKWVSETVDRSAVHGVENELLVLQKMLGKGHGGNGNGFKAIGIVGVGGIGKSTISKAFLQIPEAKSKFLPRIWVSMSKKSTGDNPDPKIALLNRILISLGENTNLLAGQTLAGLLYALRLQLRGKRYLIVLDDAKEQQIEEQQKWYSDLNSSSEEIGEKLRDGFPKGDGGAVIVTSRSHRAAKLMVGEGNLRCLDAQKDPESFWKIFWQEVGKIGGSIQNPSNLKQLKVELLKKCGGLPLAAKMMGQIKLDQEN